MKLKVPLPSNLKSPKLWIVILALLLMGFFALIPVRIAIAFAQFPEPQAILVLNGNLNRLEYATQVWQQHQDFHIWITAESNSSMQSYGRIFARGGIPPDRIHYDRCATDTVTNFTCTVADFVNQQKYHLYLITSDYHMARSRAIATIVLGSRGIVVSPLSVPSQSFPPESRWRIARDCLRSLLWIFTGRTGASMNPRLNN